MRTIRRNTFETNSSSTHSITICTEDQYNDFKKGLLWRYEGELLDIEDVKAQVKKWWPEHLKELLKYLAEDDMDSVNDILSDCCIETLDAWESRMEDVGLDTYTKSFTTPSGDKMIAWGHYGYSG